MYKTEKCIACFKPAVTWSGHLLVDDSERKIVAGWCDKHSPALEKNRGLNGAWRKRFGAEPYNG